jgi:hypothetical protein
MAGRTRIPIEIRRQQGTLKARHLRRAEAGVQLPPGDLGDPPAHLDERAKAEWARVRAITDLQPILNSTYRPILEQHCALYSRFVADCLGERRMTEPERRTFHSIQIQLGWTPTTINKVPKPKVAEPADPWAKLG